MTLNVSLTPQLEEMVRKKVESGHYASASEVVREALRRMEILDRRRDEQRAALRQKIDEAWNSGPGIPAEEVFKGIRQHIEKIEKESGKQ